LLEILCVTGSDIRYNYEHLRTYMMKVLEVVHYDLKKNNCFVSHQGMGRGEEGVGRRRGVKKTLDNAPHAAVHADPKPKSKQEKKAERDHHRYHEMKIGQLLDGD
jgi:hypothetical protein